MSESSGYMTEERKLIQQSAREFTRDEVVPVANKLDPEKGQIPRDLIDKMGALGYFGILIPEELGGLGLGVFEYCLVAEELSRGWMSVASIIARGNGFYRSIPGFGDERRKKIARMARGDYLGAFAMSEPNAGSDMAAVSCRARREGDEWVINGNKYWCTFADESDFIHVVCRVETDRDERQAGMKGIPVEKPRGELPKGVSGAPIPKIGYHGWKTYELAFDNVRVPAFENPEGEWGGRGPGNSGFVGIQQGLEVARAHTAARSIGLACGSLQVAMDYAKERVQFGQPIANFQAIRFKIATMATEIEAARQLMYYNLPANVSRVAHQCALDWFGCALAGSREHLSIILRDEFSRRQGRCRILGSNLTLEPATAALLNGASGHALDYDDTNAKVMCHATAPLFPAVLAMAEEIGASGAELITAFVVGVEIEGRIGNAIGPQHYRKGWHATGTFGTFGAAAGVAHLLKLDEQAYATAMALAASAASGLKANFGTMTKPYHAGQAAERGLIAARLAARGFTANPDAINGNQGYIQAAGVGEIDESKLNGLADKWLILDSLFKFHAACHLTHASIESILQLRDKLDASSIQSTELRVHPDLLDVCGIEAPRTGLEGKFSLCANAALAWLGMDTSDPETYVDEVICRDDVQSALQRVSVEMSTQMTGMQTSVICVDHDQKTHEAHWDSSIPCTDLNLQEKRLRRKFERLSAPIVGSSSGLGELLLRLGEQPSLEVLSS